MIIALLIFIALSLFILAFCLALSLLKIFSQNTMQILTCFIIINIASILSCLFVAIANEILSENDKNYIVGYFSALTSFSALIVSLVAFLKK